MVHKESADDIHEFRKKVKYLRYQVVLLNRLWPPVMETLEKELHHLTDYCGELNDLKNLQQAIRRKGSSLSEKEKKNIGFLIDNRREYLTDQAIKLERKIYAESPAAFCDRMGSYWESHSEEIEKDG